MSNVKLAIRVRPFTERELRSEKDKVPVVNVLDDKTVTITNLKVSASGAGDSRERVRRYHADYTFDSACAPTNPEYATQEKVFESIGRDVMTCLSRLSSVCVLAYGQSATGKTHTMMGTDTQPGLVPRLCRELASVECDVTISFLEIYNERVHDLLVGEDPPLTFNSLPRRRGNARKDLRVREHPTRGPYVQNLRRVAVTTVEALLALVSEGCRRRRTAATRRNSSSSRSHALLELSTPKATLHLADLAGSEKASWEGIGGGRQKEGANINKSLVALSNVISALVSGSSGRGRFVPYRDSALTWLLKDCFTGGACTFIIATVSPSVACYGESASTLRWTSRARQLPPPRVAPSARASVQAHYNNLLAELCRHHIKYVPETGGLIYEESHWDLKPKNVEIVNGNAARIGNFMDMLQQKTDTKPESVDSVHTSSDVLNLADEKVNIANEINKEVDKLLVPALERTRSDLEIVAPLRHKRRHYRSQEVLPIDKTLHEPMPLQTHERIRENAGKSNVPILYDNQRAEIVASVTERLYSKLKKKEEAAVSKVESMVDKKIVEPLSELKICTNARQRLMELSQKALRNKRRIGIPAHTQTRRSVIRVKDQGIDAQTDLESYSDKNKNSLVACRDASTETKPLTPRCKEIAIGPKCGSLLSYDKSTATEAKQVILKSTFVMTDDAVRLDRYTQTRVHPPPRRKRSGKSIVSEVSPTNNMEECISMPIISINISQRYAESESQSSDENLDLPHNDTPDRASSVGITPDLLTNHSSVESAPKGYKEPIKIHVASNQLPCNVNDMKRTKGIDSFNIEDFPDAENCELPRVSVNCSSKASENEMKDIILGRNDDVYPYNIILSPPRENNTKRIVKFKEKILSPPEQDYIPSKHLEDNEIPDCNFLDNSDNEASNSQSFNGCMNSQMNFTKTNDHEAHNSVVNHNSDIHNTEIDNDGVYQACGSSDSVDSGKVDSDSFIWEQGGAYHVDYKPYNLMNYQYTPVKQTKSKYRTAKSRIYREFLGLDEKQSEKDNRYYESLNWDSTRDYSSSESNDTVNPRHKFLQSKKFFEDQYKKCNKQNDIYDQLEKQILDSCSSLEMSADKYNRYLVQFRRNSTGYSNERTPKKYLEHLVKLRREVVKADSDTTDSQH
ncbi:kinesin-like protein KIN-12F [Leguminivora glycinivorella]|uniref:kinesin-like protein KIN-12F n=1 Tax=Leguminivora glycinivorella TaxID=1035111 RepID=UPI00200DD771|nr:kinesin-like protein KIN-12F [Leguminivora glycinivorella]